MKYGGREKKSAKFWATHPSGPPPFRPHFFWVRAPAPWGPHPLGSPPLRGPHFLGPHPFGPLPFGPPPSQGPNSWPPPFRALTKTKKLAKCGQIRMAKTGWAKCGRDPHHSPSDEGAQSFHVLGVECPKSDCYDKKTWTCPVKVQLHQNHFH